MNARKIVLVTGLCLTLLCSAGCHNDWNDWWTDWDVEGVWEVSEVSWENRVIFSYTVHIDQHGQVVVIKRGDQQLSDGYISGNSIWCDGWYGYGINRIYIESERFMRSETPGNESLNVIEFHRMH